MFADFDQTENRLLLADLGILPFYDSLKAAQEAFNLISDQKAEELTEYKNDSEAATEILPELFPALINLVAIIQLYSHLDPPKYGVIYNHMVTYMTETNAVARQRRSRKEE